MSFCNFWCQEKKVYHYDNSSATFHFLYSSNFEFKNCRMTFSNINSIQFEYMYTVDMKKTNAAPSETNATSF